MLTDDVKNEIRDRLKAVAASMPAFRSRPGQRVMIAEVAKALGRCPDPVPEGQPAPARPETGTSILLAQGGTGIGKSLAYSLPTAILARHKKKKVVISTATVALQEQLIGRDLPNFFKAAGLDVRVEIAKGRTRYLCNSRLAQAADDMGQLAMFGYEERAKDRAEESGKARALIAAMIEQLGSGAWNGDRDKWAEPIDSTLWSALTTDHHGCLGMKCPAYRGCAQIEARRRLKDADVIVANHALVLADLAKGGKILGKPEEAFYVVDEAHHLPDVAVDSFATSYLVGSGRRTMDKVGAFARALVGAMGSAHAASAMRLTELAARAEEHLAESFEYFASLAQLTPTEASPNPTLEFELSCIPDEFRSLGDSLVRLTADLLEQLGASAEAISDRLGADKATQPLYEKLLADSGAYRGHIEEIHETWELFLEEPDLEQPPVAKWVETTRIKGRTDYRMSASPVLATGYLRRHFWEKAAGVVLTSATLTSLGNFDHFKRRAGLTGYAHLTCIDVPSPFKYPELAALEIPKMTSLPRDYAAHTAEVAAFVRQHIERAGAEGVLVLFTSRRQLDDVLKALPKKLRGIVQSQGDGSKSAIIAAHKDRIDRGQPSVIFGLDSLSEGVDLVGRYCVHVIIAKLPFSVPDDPILRTLSDWVTRRGGNPFYEISVPDAARKLEQAAGRLIRTETDVGKVTVLDTRLWNTRFGKAILKGLPPYRLVVMGREVTL
jgi:ATP-dependent DNA helicase DinG